MSIRDAAEQFRIPRSTLHGHVSVKIQLAATGGRNHHLLDTVEDGLAPF